ncbi:hypothetical protein ALI144C_52370 [Actinosynnema sp. ALI-1.44]|nr:hypothetical protein ALI144C_52370 [Actinosynnema sp. ALI-1.44]
MTASGVLGVAVLVGVAGYLASVGLEKADKLASVIGALAGLAALGVSLRGGLSRTSQVPDPPPVGAGPHAAALHGLALAIQRQWRAESDLRRVSDPWPLPVRWVNTRRPVADHWDAVRGKPGRTEALDLAGTLEEITEVYARVPSKRLVLLGESGAGKTVLLMWLVLGLLDRRAPCDPVPVIFPVSSWDPSVPLETWLVSKLEEEYPGLAAPTPQGTTPARELVDADLVLPVLDGLDELPDGLRKDALRGINATLSRLTGVVVSCRGDEYETAVRSGDVLSRAAVVELCPLTVAEIQEYLRVTTPPHRTEAWHPVFDAMAEDPDGPVPQALSTPLMTWLARVGYSDSDKGPAELLAEPTREQVEGRLLDRYLPTVYTGTRWRADAAHRWLHSFAVQLDRLGTRDLAWWQLARTVPGLRYAMGISAVLLYLAMILALHAFVYRSTTGIGDGLLIALEVGVVAVLLGSSKYTRPPARIAIRTSDQGRDASKKFLRWLWYGIWTGLLHGMLGALLYLFIKDYGVSYGVALALVAGPLMALESTATYGVRIGLMDGVVAAVVYGLVGANVGTLWLGLASALTAGLLHGFVAGIVFSLIFGLGVPEDPATSRDPHTVLSVDRGSTIALAVALGLVLWILIGLAFAPQNGWASGVVWGFQIGFSATALLFLSASSWWRFTVARVVLALSGRAPLRLMAFMDDAHRRGVLRQFGGVYQFRHSRLQDRLLADGGSSLVR